MADPTVPDEKNTLQSPADNGKGDEQAATATPDAALTPEERKSAQIVTDALIEDRFEASDN